MTPWNVVHQLQVPLSLEFSGQEYWSGEPFSSLGALPNPGLNGKESACNVRDPGSNPWSERSPEKGMATHSSILAWRTGYKFNANGLIK